MAPSMQSALLQCALWYCVIAWSTWFGGTLYQMLVIVPLWSKDPPRSVPRFFGGTRYPQTVRHFFGPPFMAARALPVAIALGLAWDLPEHRMALGVAFGCVAAAILHTKFYVYPINAVLIDRAGADVTGNEIHSLARAWVAHDRVRFAVGSVALGSLLWAFRLPIPDARIGPPPSRVEASTPAAPIHSRRHLMNPASPEHVARRLIDEGFSQGRLSIVDDLVAPDMKEYQSRGPGHPQGAEGVKAVITTLRSAFEDFRLSIEDLAVRGDTVWTRNLATGVHRGAFGGLQPTGRRISIAVFDVMRVHEGQIVEHWGLPDHMTMMAQLRG